MDEMKRNILSEFECQKSGNCCRCPGLVHVSIPEMEKMAEEKKCSLDEFISTYTQRHNGRYVVATPTFRQQCFLNDKNQCSVYNARPEQCKTYPDWPEIWESPSTIQKETELCPGLKKAVNKAYPEGI